MCATSAARLERSSTDDAPLRAGENEVCGRRGFTVCLLRVHRLRSRFGGRLWVSVAPPAGSFCQSILTDPHDEFAPLHSITSSPRFAERNIMEDLPGLPDQSALTHANFAALPHFSVSAAMSL